jgi:drug/metabolite transporter (DMT)-like permease
MVKVNRMPPRLLLALAALLWAGNFVVGRTLVEVLPPFGMNAIRWCIALAALLPLTLVWEGRASLRVAGKLWLPLLIMGATGVLLFNSLVYLALESTTSVNAALITAATPTLTLLILALIGDGRPTPRGLLGTFVGLSGVGLVVLGGASGAILSLNPGDAVMLVAAVCWAIYTVVGGKVSHSISPLAATTTSAAVIFPLVLLAGGIDLAGAPPAEASAAVFSGLLYIGLAAAVAAFLAWNAGVARLGAARAAIFLNLIPVFTAALAVPLLGERLTAVQLSGGLLVFLGVVLVSSDPLRSR